MNNNMEYVIVNVNGGFAHVYDFCTPETAQKVIDRATEKAKNMTKEEAENLNNRLGHLKQKFVIEA